MIGLQRVVLEVVAVSLILFPYNLRKTRSAKWCFKYLPLFFFFFVEDRRSHLTGIMIGATCGIIFIVLCFLAVVHTRKHRFQRAHSRPSELTSTASFDVHEANAPPSYATGMLLSWSLRSLDCELALDTPRE